MTWLDTLWRLAYGGAYFSALATMVWSAFCGMLLFMLPHEEELEPNSVRRTAKRNLLPCIMILGVDLAFIVFW